MSGAPKREGPQHKGEGPLSSSAPSRAGARSVLVGLAARLFRVVGALGRMLRDRVEETLGLEALALLLRRELHRSAAPVVAVDREGRGVPDGRGEAAGDESVEEGRPISTSPARSSPASMRSMRAEAAAALFGQPPTKSASAPGVTAPLQRARGGRKGVTTRASWPVVTPCSARRTRSPADSPPTRKTPKFGSHWRPSSPASGLT